jgi:hypothetical protein
MTCLRNLQGENTSLLEQSRQIQTGYAKLCPDQIGVRLENGIYGHSRFCNTDFDDKLACLNLSGV